MRVGMRHWEDELREIEDRLSSRSEKLGYLQQAVREERLKRERERERPGERERVIGQVKGFGGLE